MKFVVAIKVKGNLRLNLSLVCHISSSWVLYLSLLIPSDVPFNFLYFTTELQLISAHCVKEMTMIVREADAVWRLCLSLWGGMSSGGGGGLWKK